eukprot:jgi/Mesen1/7354/ME000379S06591
MACGQLYTTTRATLTHRDADSMLGAMFSGRHLVVTERGKDSIFIDRDGKHFRHVLNWLRDGVIPPLDRVIYQELLHEAQYYQLTVNAARTSLLVQ